MSGHAGEYTRTHVEDLIPNPLYNNTDVAKEALTEAANEDVVRFLIEDHKIDEKHDGEQGIGEVRRAVLQLDSERAPFDLKQRVATRGDYTPRDIRVPERVQKAAEGALETGKPVVLYGPTGTGKTTFAKQLALKTSVGYTIETASPSWTKQDIVGRVAPDYSEDTISYKKELGCVSKAVARSREFEEEYAVIIDELTRADISKIFGPLYTAIENPHQTIFRTDDGDTIQLDPEVNIICTMNMSDRTVNQLDNAITRRFAMIEVNTFSEEDRRELFSLWIDEEVDESNMDPDELQRLFHEDYNRLNGEGESDEGIIQFGPMHYRDVADFVGETTSSGGVYEDDPDAAVGEAFRTYITPRLLNAASYSQVNDLVDHYQELDDELGFSLSRSTELVQSELQSQQQQMGATK